MRRGTIWFWICIAYLVLTVTYNLWIRWVSASEPNAIVKVALAINLTCKIAAIGLLIFRRVEGVYLLGVAFAVGVAGTLWDYSTSQDWEILTLGMKINRVSGFAISLAIIVYMAAFIKRDASVALADSASIRISDE